MPGPTLRCKEGDRLRITFINGSSHPHSIHFHGIHRPSMDGMLPVQPGEHFVYEFDADPFGLHLYHCHTVPFRRHIHKGLYGAFITVFLALGAGAIAQVVYEVGRLIMRQSREDGTPVLSRATFGGLIAGVAIMYATALLVAG